MHVITTIKFNTCDTKQNGTHLKYYSIVITEKEFFTNSYFINANMFRQMIVINKEILDFIMRRKTIKYNN